METEKPVISAVLDDTTPASVTKPFLKWLGGKTKLMPVLEPLLQGTGRFIEPFVGSGTVSLNLFCHNTAFTSYLLADINQDLIRLYEQLRDVPDFIDQCRTLFTPTNNSSAQFYIFRDEFNKTINPTRRACLFVYLNRHCFNGVCRYNASGNFNVPYGRAKTIYFPEDGMLAFKRMLSVCALQTSGFQQIISQAIKGDTIYCDPPYVPLSASASFTAYAKNGFTLAEQQSLVTEAKQAAGRGARVVISNHDTPLTRELYKDATLLEILVRRSVSGKGSSRVMAKELIAVFQPSETQIQ